MGLLSVHRVLDTCRHFLGGSGHSYGMNQASIREEEPLFLYCSGWHCFCIAWFVTSRQCTRANDQSKR